MKDSDVEGKERREKVLGVYVRRLRQRAGDGSSLAQRVVFYEHDRAPRPKCCVKS